MNILANVNWSSFGIVMLLLSALAVIFTVLILVVHKFCAVSEDPLIGEVQDKLSGANCGGCGFAGCSDFAKAVVEGRADVSSCAATSKENKATIAKLLGKEVVDEEPKIAVVRCAGETDKTNKKFTYIGNKSCEALACYFGGDKTCSFACLGGGSCEKACKFDSVHVENGVAKTDKDTCTACGACAKACPKHVIDLIPKSAPVYVACSSKCKGKDVMDGCKVGCIGCGLCAKNCPSAAIQMVDNLPVIDYAKCTGCKTCVLKCPRKIIREL